MDRAAYRKWRREQIKREKRDREIYKVIQYRMQKAGPIPRIPKIRLANYGELAVFFPREGSRLKEKFPIFLHNGRRMPRWIDLSQWMKMQVTLLALYDYGALVFTANLHPDLEAQWVAEGRRIVACLRDRFRKALKTEFGDSAEYAFVVEGHTKGKKKRTRLHMHGYACLSSLLRIEGCQDRNMAEELLKRALKRTAGYDPDLPAGRAVHADILYSQDATFGTYITKRIPTPDDRLLDGHKMVMSHGMTQGGRIMWEGLSGRWEYHLKQWDGKAPYWTEEMSEAAKKAAKKLAA